MFLINNLVKNTVFSNSKTTEFPLGNAAKSLFQCGRKDPDRKSISNFENLFFD